MSIYLDNAATTPVDPAVREAMLPYFTDTFGNPSSAHRFGQQAHVALNSARQQAANALGCELDEIVFTGSATESNNTILLGYARANRARGNHIITSMIEHDCILRACSVLENEGFSVTYLPVNPDGLVSVESFEKACTKETILASIMAANNEIGTLQPIQEMAEIAHQKNIFFHTDAVQYYGYYPCKMYPDPVVGAENLSPLRVDALTLSAHKFYGPKGVGLLYIRKSDRIGTKIEPLLVGGGQEFGLRAGTQNVGGIVGMGIAMELIEKNRSAYATHVFDIRETLWQILRTEIPDVRINGSPSDRLPNNLNIHIPGIRAETLLIRLDLAGIAVSTGSACSVNQDQSSHVLQALHLHPEEIDSSIRITLSKNTILPDIETAGKTLGSIVKELRKT